MLKKLAITSFTLLVLLTLMGAGTVDPTWVELLMPVYYAIVNGQYALASALAIVAAVWLTRRYLTNAVPWFGSSQGGATLTLIFGSATALVAGLSVPGAHMGFDLLKNAVIQGIYSGGTYVLLKHIIVDPYIRPWVVKAPAWLRPILGAVLSIFDSHVPTFGEVVRKAEKAGVDAVIEQPGTGVQVILGNPRVVE